MERLVKRYELRIEQLQEAVEYWKAENSLHIKTIQQQQQEIEDYKETLKWFASNSRSGGIAYKVLNKYTTK